MLEGRNDLLVFSINELNYLAEYNRDADPFFFRILLPNIATHNDDGNLIIQRLNSRFKTGKAFITDNEVWISVETFVYGNVDYPLLFTRMIEVAREMFNEYRNSENEQHG
ncbi:MAG: hypothetical protein NC548_28665 [Lachnospiraceae bacterium]|nr:hypothetical protein [Lachnospiraceae bacterium]